MILQLRNIETQQLQEYRPRNKARCEGFIFYHRGAIANISEIFINYIPGEDLVGGTFSVDWHRCASGTALDGSPLDIQLTYTHREEGAHSWLIENIQLLKDAGPLALDVSDLLGAPLTFFALRMEYRSPCPTSILPED